MTTDIKELMFDTGLESEDYNDAVDFLNDIEED